MMRMVRTTCVNCMSTKTLILKSPWKLRNFRSISTNLEYVTEKNFKSSRNFNGNCSLIQLRTKFTSCESRYTVLGSFNGVLNKKTKYAMDCLQLKSRFSSKSSKRENILTVPNMLCLLRISLAPAIAYLLLNSENQTALILLGVAGVTDLLDGYIARNFPHQSTVFGSMLDPAADKVLMTVTTVTLAWVNLLPVYLCALIVGRDIGIMSAVAYLRYTTVPKPITLAKFFDVNLPSVQMKPTFISKVNTGFQLGLVGLCMSAPVFGFTESTLLSTYLYFVGATTVLSGLSYVIKGSQTFRVLK